MRKRREIPAYLQLFLTSVCNPAGPSINRVVSLKAFTLTRGYITNDHRNRASCDIEEVCRKEAIGIWMKGAKHPRQIAYDCPTRNILFTIGAFGF